MLVTHGHGSSLPVSIVMSHGLRRHTFSSNVGLCRRRGSGGGNWNRDSVPDYRFSTIFKGRLLAEVMQIPLVVGPGLQSRDSEAYSESTGCFHWHDCRGRNFRLFLHHQTPHLTEMAANNTIPAPLAALRRLEPCFKCQHTVSR